MSPGRINYEEESFCSNCDFRKPKGVYCKDCGEHLRNTSRGPSRQKIKRKRY